MSNLYRVAVDGLSNSPPDADCIPFSAGNPSVEHVIGTLHLYRPRDLYANNAELEGPSGATDQVCVLAVPGDIGFRDFCQFLGSYVSGISKMWMVRREDTPSKTMCMALLQFKAVDDAAAFISDYNGRPFSALEPDVICRCVAVSHVEMAPQPTAAASPSALPSSPTLTAPPLGHVELPTCPVCLERLDEHISGVITTVCNHKFHNECLQKWGDASCPVCRYCMQNNSASNCDVCEASTDLWICLICGHVGCGRYKSSHALRHFQDSHHCYSLELESGRVWDYVGDGYVHRLIQSNADGKLVEVPSPGPSQSARGSQGQSALPGPSGKSAAGDDRHRSSTPSMLEGPHALDEAQMLEAMYESKVDSVSREYSHLLTSQLESQRSFFEELRTKDTIEHARQLQSAELQLVEQRSLAAQATGRVRELEGNVKSLTKRLHEIEGKLKDARKEVDLMGELNRGLIDNQKVFRDKLASAEEASRGKDVLIQELQEQVRDLMVFIEAGQIVQAGENEMAGGDVVLPAPLAAKSKRSVRKSKA